MTVAYVCVAALLVLSIAAVRHGRPAISVPAVILVLATAGWNVTRAFRGPEDHEPSTIATVSILMGEIAVVARRAATHPCPVPQPLPAEELVS